MASFTQKKIRIEVTLGAGYFKDGLNTKIIEDVYCIVNISKPGSPSKNGAECQIYNLNKDDLEQLTMLAFMPGEAERNPISIFAGDDTHMALAFKGDIFPGGAYAAQNGVDTVLHINALTGFNDAVTPVSPTSYNGSISISDFVETITQSIGFSFENEHLEKALDNPYFSGSPMEQIEQACQAAGVELIIDDDQLILLEPGSARGNRARAKVLNKNTGLIDYPSFSQNGLVLRCIYDPSIIFGGYIVVESTIPRASGTWKVNSVTHQLSTLPGGPWETQLSTVYIL